MKKLVRKGFSMVELLFVMVLISSLSAVAISKFNKSSDSVIITSMKSDTRNTISYLQSLLITEGSNSFLDIGFLERGSRFFHYNGVVKTSTAALQDAGITFSLSENNEAVVRSTAAGEGTCTNEGEGFEIVVYNSEYKDRTVSFNSCKDTRIKLNKVKP